MILELVEKDMCEDTSLALLGVKDSRLLVLFNAARPGGGACGGEVENDSLLILVLLIDEVAGLVKRLWVVSSKYDEKIDSVSSQRVLRCLSTLEVSRLLPIREEFRRWLSGGCACNC